MQLHSPLFVLLTLIGLWLAPGIQAAPRADGPKNLLKNPGAETAENGRGGSWGAIAVPPGGKVKLSRVTNQAHSGKASLFGEVAGGDGFVQWVQNVDEFPRGSEMRLSGFVKTQGDAKAHIQIQAFDQAGQQLTIAVAEPTIEGAKDWTEVKTDATAIPREAKSIIVRLVLAGKGQAWFDDLSLSAVEKGAGQP